MPTKEELEKEVAELRQQLSGYRWRHMSAPTLDELRLKVDRFTNGLWYCPGCLQGHVGATALLDHVRECEVVLAERPGELKEAAPSAHMPKPLSVGDPIPPGGCGCRANGVPIMRANCSLHREASPTISTPPRRYCTIEGQTDKLCANCGRLPTEHGDGWACLPND